MKFEQLDRLKVCKVANGAPIVSHMLLADDSYLYCQATMTHVAHVMDLLRIFK